MKTKQLIFISLILPLGMIINGAGAEQSPTAIPFDRITSVSKEDGTILVERDSDEATTIIMPDIIKFAKLKQFKNCKSPMQEGRFGSRKDLKQTDRKGIICPNVDQTGYDMILVGTQNSNDCEKMQRWLENIRANR